jgi:hypothetical protein
MAASFSQSRDWTNSSMRSPTKTMMQPKTGLRRYERNKLTFHAPQTAPRLFGGP